MRVWWTNLGFNPQTSTAFLLDLSRCIFDKTPPNASGFGNKRLFVHAALCKRTDAWFDCSESIIALGTEWQYSCICVCVFTPSDFNHGVKWNGLADDYYWFRKLLGYIFFNYPASRTVTCLTVCHLRIIEDQWCRKMVN